MPFGNPPNLNMSESERRWLAEQVDEFGHFEWRPSERVLIFNSTDKKLLERIAALTGSSVHTLIDFPNYHRIVFGGRAKLYIILNQILPYLKAKREEAVKILDWIVERGISNRRPYTTWLEEFRAVTKESGKNVKER